MIGKRIAGTKYSELDMILVIFVDKDIFACMNMDQLHLQEAISTRLLRYGFTRSSR